MADTSDSLIFASKLQIHYWFSDKSHTMDALVHNKCERELLEITKAIAALCGADIKLETEPSAKGGLKCWITIVAKSEKKTPPAKITLVTTMVNAVLATPMHTSVSHIAGLLIDNMFADKEVTEVQREQLRLEIAHLKSEADSKIQALDQSNLLKKRRSNFYDALSKYKKMKSISVVMTDASRKLITEEQMVTREGFKTFILSSDQLEPLVLENILIEIISPVLAKGKYKWKGMYNGSPISFSMKSDEFISQVQLGKVEFKSGTTINCTLEIEKKINSEGLEKITSYNIIRVGSYSEIGKSTDVPEGKPQKQKPVAPRKQLDLFGN
jgi:hypothetical protein